MRIDLGDIGRYCFMGCFGGNVGEFLRNLEMGLKLDFNLLIYDFWVYCGKIFYNVDCNDVYLFLWKLFVC